MHIYIYIDILMSNDVLRSSRLSSSGPLDDLPFLANQTVQPPVQPVQPWAKSLECHVLARDMTCSPDFCSCLFILGLWSSRRAFRLLLYRLWDLYIYNEMLQPDCNNLPNALPGALHCRWICPSKEGTCEPPVIDSWKSKSMSSTSCTWVCKCYQMLNLLLWVWHSMAYLVTLCLKPSSSAWKCQCIR